MIDFPTSLTERERQLYIEYSLRDKFLKDETWLVNKEKYKEVELMLEKVKREKDYKDNQKAKMIFTLNQSVKIKSENKNYFKNKFKN